MKFRMEPGNVITFSVGLLFIAGAVYVHTSLGRFIENAREVPAVVVEVVNEGGRKARIHPVVRFRGEDGREIVATSQQHHNVTPGQSVHVVYDPAQPEEIEIGTLERVKHRRTLFTLLAAGMGILVCGLGVGLDANTLKWRF